MDFGYALLATFLLTGGRKAEVHGLEVGERAGWKLGERRTKAFRHTYCTARLQTVDRGAPVAVYTRWSGSWATAGTLW